MKAKNSGGFTLIELLVTIAIVGILASICIPAYDSYVSKARVRTAQIDMISLGMTVESMYQQSMSYKLGTYKDVTAIRAAYERWKPVEKSFDYSLEATRNSYKITATANQGKNKGCVMTVNEIADRTNNCPGSSAEWN